MRELAVVGRRKIGKTSLLERLIPLLRERGLAVAALKHSSHSHTFDRPDSDTDRLLRAGARRAMVISAEEGAVFIRPEESEIRRAREILAGGCDLLLIEGHRRAPGPKIWISSPDDEPPAGVVAVVGERAQLSDVPSLRGVPLFAPEEAARLADWVLQELEAGRLAGRPLGAEERTDGPPPKVALPHPESVRRRSVTRLAKGREGRSRREDTLVREERVELHLNDELLLALSCLPHDLEAWALGFLFGEGILEDPAGLTVTVDREHLAVHARGPVREELVRAFRAGRTLTSGCAAGVSGLAGISERRGECLEIDTELRVEASTVVSLMRELRARSPLYLATGGAHTAALAHPERGILHVAEDIGRHTAVDKVLGMALLEGRSPAGLMLLASGRLSSEMVSKAVAARVPLVISRAAPTELAVRLASRHLVTLVGFARGERMNVYSVPERIS